MKDKAKAARENGTRVAKNIYEFLEACSLAAVSGWAIYTCRDGNTWVQTGILLAGIYIALRAAQLYWRHFNR